MSIFRRIGRGLKRRGSSQDPAEKPDDGTVGGHNPYLDMVQSSELREFPPEERAGDGPEDDE